MITIIDYKAGNLTSVQRALTHLGLPSRITPDADEVRRSERIIFPGVGHAGAAMAVLKERGLDGALKEAFARGTPILGICVGCQILLDHSEEADTPCLGLIPGRCRRFAPSDRSLKIPHMGWNPVEVRRPHPLLSGLKPGDAVYFVHSYYTVPDAEEHAFAETEYGIRFASAIGRANLFATQFHLEKSAGAGLGVLERFAHWDGSPC
ncbi:MAG: imidazole glycerol phosphate synthase subunit HisH [Spirochaetes bacterium]|nr:imidazole glycerol phosphate synthase subunit HisH [Spirochaetota bacterium]